MNGSQHLLNGFGIGFGHWHSFKCLRAGRESELMREYDLATVCKWIGNSPAVWARHYATSIDLNADFQRAAGVGNQAQQKARQSADADPCQQQNIGEPKQQKSPGKPGQCQFSASGGNCWLYRRMGPTRFELVTSSLSGTRSNQLSYEPVFRETGNDSSRGGHVNGPRRATADELASSRSFAALAKAVDRIDNSELFDARWDGWRST